MEWRTRSCPSALREVSVRADAGPRAQRPVAAEVPRTGSLPPAAPWGPWATRGSAPGKHRQAAARGPRGLVQGPSAPFPPSPLLPQERSRHAARHPAHLGAGQGVAARWPFVHLPPAAPHLRNPPSEPTAPNHSRPAQQQKMSSDAPKEGSRRPSKIRPGTRPSHNFWVSGVVFGPVIEHT